MSRMCQLCGLEITTPESGNVCNISLCTECEKKSNASSSSGETSVCNSSVTMNPSGPHIMSMTSSPICLSNCVSDDIQAQTNLQLRNDGLDTGQCHLSQGTTERVEEHRNGSLFQDINVDSSDDNSAEDNLSCNSSEVDNRGEEINNHGSVLPDNSDEVKDSGSNGILSLLHTTESDPCIWTPPEPEDREQDIDSVANNDDDDDDYNDGTKWGQPSSLSSLDEELGNRHTDKEERQKALMEAMNVELKNIVSQLLDGVTGVPDKDNFKNWLNIVTSLSWEAALLIKPDANAGRAMDPVSYLKVKCVASGACNQSKVVKGLVFKKNTANKHMETKFRNPSVLLIQGSLGYSAVGLSSLVSVKEEDNYNKRIIEMIESCHPNIVLVEKTASRDIQLSLLDRGITLIVDMKLQRLERIARCLGSRIISSVGSLVRPELKKCDSFRIEKFVEDHNCSGEGAKKLCKTLMFLEGCPRPLGCTILLKGAHSDKLKTVKGVVHYAVFAAYHLINETNFFADQRIYFCDMNAAEEFNGTSKDKAVTSVSCGAACIPHLSKTNTPIDIPISNGSIEKLILDEMNFNLNQSSDASKIDDIVQVELAEHTLPPGKMLSSMSASLRKFLTVPHTTDSISSYCGVNENILIKQEETDEESSNSEKTEINPDPHSILVMLSTYCIPKQKPCESGHLSRIKYYGNSDVSLGRYLQDILNQKRTCSLCGGPPESHVYCYTHQNGTLTVRVRNLSKESTLSGESEGKIWMWMRCLKCEDESGTGKSTKRVVMSSAARGLSFGKFLQLSFSSPSAARRLSRCGHSLQRDCLRFFGLGSKVAMFKYSSVEIFSACKPPPVLEFCSPSEQEWFAREAKDVLSKGDHFFMEVANLLKKLKSNCSGTLLKHSLNVSGLVLKLDEVEEMLMQDKTEFEAPLLKGTNHSALTRENDHEILDLNWFMHELLFLLYIWDSRLSSISLCCRDEGTSNKNLEGSTLEDGVEVCDIPIQSPLGIKESASDSSDQAENITPLEIKVEIEPAELCNSEEISIQSVPVQSEPQEHVEKSSDLEPGNATHKIGGYESQKYEDFEEKDPKRWIWVSFSELRKTFRNDLQRGFLYKFEFINTYTPTYLSPMPQLVTLTANSLHFPIGPGCSVVSTIEDEISSIIACSLAIASEARGGKCEMDNAAHNVHKLTLNSLSPSFPSFSSDEFPEIPLGSAQFSGKSRYSVVCVYSKQFFSLRKRCCSSEMAYISSLSRCKKWDAQGGKSKVSFAKTMDDRFIIKQIKKTELDSFLKFGPDYFKHITGSLDSGSQTCLAKIMGIYQVRQTKNGKDVKTDLVVMENVFFGRNIWRKYDLKGAVFSRYISNSDDSESVFQDENFVKDMGTSPIYLGGKSKHLLQRAIWNDTSFLTSINVMDYSLLVGVDKQKHEIVFGIIDYLRQYTWDKQLETWVKASLVVPKNELPTVISPKEYKKRFRKFMTKYFLTVPDTWCSEKCANSCKICTGGSGNSSNLQNVKLAD